MPRYFFDVSRDSVVLVDEDGQEFVDDNAARREALGVLMQLARELTPSEDRHDLRCDARDQEGRMVYTAALLLDGRWLRRPGPTPAPPG